MNARSKSPSQHHGRSLPFSGLQPFGFFVSRDDFGCLTVFGIALTFVPLSLVIRGGYFCIASIWFRLRRAVASVSSCLSHGSDRHRVAKMLSFPAQVTVFTIFTATSSSQVTAFTVFTPKKIS